MMMAKAMKNIMVLPDEPPPKADTPSGKRMNRPSTRNVRKKAIVRMNDCTEFSEVYMCVNFIFF